MGTRYGSRYGTATDVAASLGRPRHAASAVGGRVYPNQSRLDVGAETHEAENRWKLGTGGLGPRGRWTAGPGAPVTRLATFGTSLSMMGVSRGHPRSEERRVGKECRSRCAL